MPSLDTDGFVRLASSQCLLIDPNARPDVLYAEGRHLIHRGRGLLTSFVAGHHPDKILVDDMAIMAQVAADLVLDGMLLIECSQQPLRC